MSKLQEYLMNMKDKEEALLLNKEEAPSKSKEDYIQNAEIGLIVAFRLNFEAKSGVKLTKVISGKIVENDSEKGVFILETRNGLTYGVPYSSVVWVKTGGRWPKGVYEEMKKGSVVIDNDQVSEEIELGELEDDLTSHLK